MHFSDRKHSGRSRPVNYERHLICDLSLCRPPGRDNLSFPDRITYTYVNTHANHCISASIQALPFPLAIPGLRSINFTNYFRVLSLLLEEDRRYRLRNM
ncbi:unnamed protein product [Hymenolepis diminuta]|uniref:Uncharacterized protein n=1 Tax=Hymenolepis diminuta TaxID=6216 RepID=A0A564YP71_HYMDI|nr:unnamed protein product [Hymenolepis diminuta]